MKKPLTAERARELLAYEPETGLLRWRMKLGSRAPAGGVCTSFCKQSGYYQVRLDKVNYQQHRVIWLMVHGEWPFQIDHKDRNRANNRIDNLRPTCDALNRQNVEKARKDSRTGIQGVSVHKTTGLFVAAIRKDGKLYYLGTYPTTEEARRVYLDAKAQLHPAWVPSDAAPLAALSDNYLLNANGGRRVRSDSRTGVVGVYPYYDQFRARFARRHVGTFPTIAQAEQAVLAARAMASKG